MQNNIITYIRKYIFLSIGIILQSVSFMAFAVCDIEKCSYSITLDKAGFYVPVVKLPATAKEGFWGLSLNTSSGLNEGGFNAGGVLGENATYPGFIGFYLNKSEKVTISAYEYTGAIKELTVSISDADKNFVLSPTIFKTNDGQGESKETAELAPGFYTASVYNRSGDPRGRFGISLLGKSFGGGVNVGGWIDSVTGGTGEGFGGLYISSPQQVNLQILFGNSYGSAGAERSNVELYLQETLTGVRTLQWSSVTVDTVVEEALKKISGSWKFIATRYPETTITFASFDPKQLIVSGTDQNNVPVYVKYDTDKQKFYLYSAPEKNYYVNFWFHFVSDNAVSGCLTNSSWFGNDQFYDTDCSLGGTLVSAAQ